MIGGERLPATAEQRRGKKTIREGPFLFINYNEKRCLLLMYFQLSLITMLQPNLCGGRGLKLEMNSENVVSVRVRRLKIIS